MHTFLFSPARDAENNAVGWEEKPVSDDLRYWTARRAFLNLGHVLRRICHKLSADINYAVLWSHTDTQPSAHDYYGGQKCVFGVVKRVMRFFTRFLSD